MMPHIKYHSRCWNCGHECDSIRSIDSNPDLKPSNGDLSICLKCGSPAIFDDTMPDGVRKPTPQEKREFLELVEAVMMDMMHQMSAKR